MHPWRSRHDQDGGEELEKFASHDIYILREEPIIGEGE